MLAAVSTTSSSLAATHLSSTMHDDEPDTATLRRLNAMQERNRCKTCGAPARLQAVLTEDWMKTGEVEVQPVKSCDCS